PDWSDSIATISLAGMMPLHPHGRNSARWRVINGGHLQRCIPAIAMVETAAPYRVCVHMSTRVDVYQGIWRVSFSAHGPGILVNDEYRVLYNGLCPCDPNDAGSSDAVATLLPGTRGTRRRVHR